MNTAFERNQQREEWLTPKWLIDALAPFDLDPCASVVRPWPTAKQHYTIQDNGLLKPWAGFTYCNPPYGRQTSKWLRRMAEHNNGIALTFARTETAQFFESVWTKASCVVFIRSRLIFVDTDGKPALNKDGRPQGAGAPSVLIGYGPEGFRRLMSRDIPGRFVNLWPRM